MEPTRKTEPDKEHAGMTIAEWIIFGFRYPLTLLYVVTTLASGSYLAHACWETILFAIRLWNDEQSATLVGVLTLLDEMMITSLLFLIIGGSFLVYVQRRLSDRVFKHESDRPPAFTHLSPSSLKTKMSGALVGVSAVLIIRVLVQALEVPAAEMDNFIKRACVIAGIHIVLVISLVVFARMSMGEDHGTAHEHDSDQTPKKTKPKEKSHVPTQQLDHPDGDHSSALHDGRSVLE